MKEVLIVSLQELLLQGTEEKVHEILAAFRCKKDSDIESFLRNRAIEFERIAKSRTYLVCDLEEIKNKRFFILGYFALSLKVLVLPDDMSVRGRKELDGFSGKIYGQKIREIPCYLIGQLSRNDDATKEDLSGKGLIDLALSVIQMSVAAVGGRCVLVECHNEETLESFYKRNGFRRIMDEPDDTIPMVQMLRMI
ncbi:MAG: hypothetical protein IK016_09725 [Lachnospiraceae bacterium]|nr:hypothetical protein [Lachnospiraceae bacterium]